MADKYPMHDRLKKAAAYCTVISRFWYRPVSGFGLLGTEPTATVTFIKVDNKTYAVTARHVIEAFAAEANKNRSDGRNDEGYFCPNGRGVAIGPPFITPPASLIVPQAPDIAIRPIHSDLPKYIGKEAFTISEEDDPDPSKPITHALALGFPTDAKQYRAIDGPCLAMPSVAVVAEGTGYVGEDQINFRSELESRPAWSDFSGMSGGPVFWSDERRCGLIGFIKEGQNNFLAEDQEQAISMTCQKNSIHFLCQRADSKRIKEWVSYVDRHWHEERAQLAAKAFS